jgi:hypothetical protein
MTSRRVPPASSISGHSGAWIRPSTVQSTITSTRFNASMTARFCWIAQDVPVDFTGTGAVWRGVGIWIMQYSAPRSCSARSDKCTSTGRDCVSDRMATFVPLPMAFSAKTRRKLSSHLPSIRSCSIARSPLTRYAKIDFLTHQLSFFSKPVNHIFENYGSFDNSAP